MLQAFLRNFPFRRRMIRVIQPWTREICDIVQLFQQFFGIFEVFLAEFIEIPLQVHVFRRGFRADVRVFPSIHREIRVYHGFLLFAGVTIRGFDQRLVIFGAHVLIFVVFGE